ncbi:D-alanyl-D-alanine carboxypeptidase [Rhodococcus sp. D2-41]|uniref:D-alanyl-D-alanine carboxypeptidase n=1 Tax=Speluncibacter jeojiensis TaxID=2710754 RepID=A0A9X4M5T3_9ACTN|nr:D-alanyl-D-alanine carboxypeptidase family protein [Rhodococcus sp. D2-41]MDG3008876.1 D-alanyl-D-alanine carboxypeptidase [Rhodococcus sp. D2-41]MDG3016497.1 D-alanyl-D-alanine carboxypeptidase [Corynebacteriales bacterium D3-21]
MKPSIRAAAVATALALAGLSAVPGTATPAAAAPVTDPGPAAPVTTPNTDACPYRISPPPPVDRSEVPSPGQTAPPPVPVPTQPVGGPGLRACGAIQAAGTPPLPQDVSAAGWVLADLDTGEVLAAKDPHGRHRPASTIKVLLAMVALQNLDLDKVVVGTQADADADGSRVGIGPGGHYSNRQLMQGLVMNSGNDAAHALAAQLGGDRATVEKMNALAHTLGGLDTRAATPSGLDGPGMSTSAYDLALFFRDAMRNPTFAELVAAPPVQFPGYPADPAIPGDHDHPGFMIANDNELLVGYPGALGGKTGYTDDAQQTYIGSAERGGRRLVVTLMQGTRKPIVPWRQAAELLDYGFALPREAAVGTLVAPGSVGGTTPTLPTVAAPPAAAVAHHVEVQATPEHERTQVLRYGLVLGGGLALLVLLLGARRLTRRR